MRSSRAISSRGATRAPGIGERCASWCSERSADRPSAPTAGGQRSLALPTMTRDLLPCSANRRGPEPIARAKNPGSRRESSRHGSARSCPPLVTEAEWPALLERAPVDLRVNVARSQPRRDAGRNSTARQPTPISPWGIRLPSDSRVDNHPAFSEGLVEVQDEGSQLIALACEPTDGERILDLCAGAGGKSLALAAVAPRRSSSRPTPTGHGCRSCRRGPSGQGRASKRACSIRPTNWRSLPTGRAPPTWCWSTRPARAAGTWRRNPEGRWRLTPERLDRLIAVQSRLLDLRRRARPARRAPGLCRLLAAVPRRGRPDRGLPNPPFIMAWAGSADRRGTRRTARAVC